jgi:hypothetical protein
MLRRDPWKATVRLPQPEPRGEVVDLARLDDFTLRATSGVRLIVSGSR